MIYEGVGFSVESGLDELDAVLTDTKPDLVWLDSWRSMWGGDENSAQEASQVLDPLRELIRRHNVGAGFLHHANKLGQYRGSTAVGASVENIVEFTKAEEDDDRRRRRLRNTACRFEQEVEDRWVRIEADRSRGLVLIDEAEPFVPSRGGGPRDERDGAADELLAALSGKFTAWPDWARAACGGLHLKTYAHVIDALEGKTRHADLDALIATARSELEAPTWRAHFP